MTNETPRRKAIRGLKLALKTADYIESKTCSCNFCKAARRLRKQLKPVAYFFSVPLGEISPQKREE